jgi:hypothetical protein
MQAVFPQIQDVLSPAPLGEDPFLILQARKVRVHMHVLEVEQGFVEEVLVLKYRSPREALEHPRGQYESEKSLAVMYAHPFALAPSSHSA